MVIIGAILIIISVAVLIGWRYNISALVSVVSSWSPMRVNAAICFLLSGFMLIILSNMKPGSMASATVVLVSIIIMIISSATLAEYIFGLNFGIDQPFNFAVFPDENTQHLGRMSFVTAFNFFLAAISFLCIKRGAALASQISSLFIFFMQFYL